MKVNGIKTARIRTAKKLSLVIILILAGFVSFAQPNEEDVVYLKNGSIIRGNIIELVPDGNITIEIMGGSVLVYPMSEVEKMTREENKYNIAEPKPHIIKHRGYFNISEIGFGFGNQNYYYGGITSSISMQTINGMQLCRHLQAGIGLGIDYYTSQPVLYNPIFIRISGDIIKSPVTPYYYADGGYTMVWEDDNNENTSYEGGWMINPGIGVKFYSRTKASYHISFGFKTQLSKYTYTNPWDNSVFEEKRKYNRLSMKLGIGF